MTQQTISLMDKSLILRLNELQWYTQLQSTGGRIAACGGKNADGQNADGQNAGGKNASGQNAALVQGTLHIISIVGQKLSCPAWTISSTTVARPTLPLSYTNNLTFIRCLLLQDGFHLSMFNISIKRTQQK